MNASTVSRNNAVVLVPAAQGRRRSSAPRPKPADGADWNLFVPAQLRKPRKVIIMAALLYVLLPVIGFVSVGIPMVGIRVIEQKSR
jgi:hypothetical protein